MKPFSLLLMSTLAVGCIQNTYEYPDCTVSDTEETSDIPTPSQDVNNSSDSDSSDNNTDERSKDTSQTETYFFDDAQSLLYVQVFKDTSTLGSDFAHNHVMRATNWTGEAVFNPADISVCEMNFSLPVVDLAVDEDAMRDLVGYGDVINSSDRATIREHMLADNQLNANQYATIWFESSDCTQTESGLIVTGDMFIAGATREIDVEMTTTLSNDSLYMNGRIDFTHSDFGMTPYEAFFGAVRNSEPLSISFDMVGFAG